MFIKVTKLTFFIFVISVIFPYNLQASRLPPAKIKQVSLNFKVMPIRHKITEKGKLSCGIIGIYTDKGKLLWWLRVYDIKIKDGLEKDIQYVYISNIKLSPNGNLIIENEQNMLFNVNIFTKEVKLISKNTGSNIQNNVITVSGKWGESINTLTQKTTGSKK